MSMSAQHHKFVSGMRHCGGPQDGASRFAHQERKPCRAGKPAGGGQRLGKRRHVGGDDDMASGGGGTLEKRCQACRICISERLFDGEPGAATRLGGEFTDETVVIEPQWRVERIAVTAIGPAVDADEGRPFIERHDAGWRQPLDIGPAGCQLDDRVANLPDGTAVVVVIAEDKMERPEGGVGEKLEVRHQTGRHRDVSGEDDGAVTRPENCVDERLPRTDGRVVPMQIAGPENPQHRVGVRPAVDLALTGKPTNPQRLSGVVPPSSALRDAAESHRPGGSDSRRRTASRLGLVSSSYILKSIPALRKPMP
jgi:hypothetical protein